MFRLFVERLLIDARDILWYAATVLDEIYYTLYQKKTLLYITIAAIIYYIVY